MGCTGHVADPPASVPPGAPKPWTTATTWGRGAGPQPPRPGARTRPHSARCAAPRRSGAGWGKREKGHASIREVVKQYNRHMPSGNAWKKRNGAPVPSWGIEAVVKRNSRRASCCGTPTDQIPPSPTLHRGPQTAHRSVAQLITGESTREPVSYGSVYDPYLATAAHGIKQYTKISQQIRLSSRP